MDCPKCGYAMSEFDTDCPRCKRLGAKTASNPAMAPVATAKTPMANTIVGKQKSKMNSWLGAAAVGVGFVVLVVVFALCSGGGSGGSGSKGIDYKLTVYENAVNIEGITVESITVLVAPGTTSEQCKIVIEDVVAKRLSGKNGSVMIFDDANAEKLQWLPYTTELSKQQQDYCDQHVKAMANILRGKIVKLIIHGQEDR